MSGIAWTCGSCMFVHDDLGTEQHDCVVCRIPRGADLRKLALTRTPSSRAAVAPRGSHAASSAAGIGGSVLAGERTVTLDGNVTHSGNSGSQASHGASDAAAASAGARLSLSPVAVQSNSNNGAFETGGMARSPGLAVAGAPPRVEAEDSSDEEDEGCSACMNP